MTTPLHYTINISMLYADDSFGASIARVAMLSGTNGLVTWISKTVSLVWRGMRMEKLVVSI